MPLLRILLQRLLAGAPVSAFSEAVGFFFLFFFSSLSSWLAPFPEALSTSSQDSCSVNRAWSSRLCLLSQLKKGDSCFLQLGYLALFFPLVHCSNIYVRGLQEVHGKRI